MKGAMRNSTILRPTAVLLACLVFLALADRSGNLLSRATAFSVLQSFATLGPVALGLGLTMMIREFDLSVAGTFSLAGCVAILLGPADPWLAGLVAILLGLAAGAVQGLIMTRLQLGSVGVTLGGLLTLLGIAYVVTGNETVTQAGQGIAQAINAPMLGIFSWRSLAALLVFAIAALLVGCTRIGRDLIAVGGDRRAARTAGVNDRAMVVGIFAVSGGLSALSGVLLAYSLAAATPSGLSEVLVPAVAAAILGGVSLSGGTGTPAGIAVGVLVLCLLRSGLSFIGASPFMHDIATGAILLLVAVADGPALSRRWSDWRRRTSPDRLKA